MTMALVPFGGAVLTLGLMAGPALAAPTPCATQAANAQPNTGTTGTPGGSCTAQGTITVNSELAIALDFATPGQFQVFSSGPHTGNQPGSVYVLSNDANGYQVDQNSTDYSATIGGKPYSIAATAVDTTQYTLDGGSVSSVPFHEGTGAGSAIPFVTSDQISGSAIENGSTPPPGWDGFGLNAFFENGTQNTVPAGSYVGTWTAALWGN